MLLEYLPAEISYKCAKKTKEQIIGNIMLLSVFLKWIYYVYSLE